MRICQEQIRPARERSRSFTCSRAFTWCARVSASSLPFVDLPSENAQRLALGLPRAPFLRVSARWADRSGGASVYDNDNARYCSRVNNSPSLMAIDTWYNNWSREQMRVSRRGRAAGFAKWRRVKSREARSRILHGGYAYFRSHGGVNNALNHHR